MGIATQGRFAKMRIVGKETAGFDKVIGEVAAAAAGHQDFLADFVAAVEYQNLQATMPGDLRAHQAGCATADNNGIVMIGF